MKTKEILTIVLIIAAGIYFAMNTNSNQIIITGEITEDLIKQEEKVEIAEDSGEEEKVTTISQVVISGKIEWKKKREARFFTRDTSITTKVDWRGRFNLTFPLDSSGYITFHHGDETTAMYCNPDDTVHITIDTREFDETITYAGSNESSFLAWKYLHVENVGYPNVKNTLDTTKLNQKLDSLTNPIHVKLISVTSNDNFIESEKKEYAKMRNYFLQQNAKNQRMVEMIGKPAIDFTYPDIDGKMVSLSDFIGSYVYVDVWATWCGPCKYEIPFLIQLETDYHDANIVFMSVSTDLEDKRKVWRDMINDKKMGGVQLISTDGWKSQILKDYAINGIPRFMLFDANGNVISTDAPRPSSEKIRKLLDANL